MGEGVPPQRLKRRPLSHWERDRVRGNSVCANHRLGATKTSPTRGIVVLTCLRRGQAEQSPRRSRWKLWLAGSKARLAWSKARVAWWAGAVGDVCGACGCPEPRAHSSRLPRMLEHRRRLPSQLTRTCEVSLVACVTENNPRYSSGVYIPLIARPNREFAQLEIVLLLAGLILRYRYGSTIHNLLACRSNRSAIRRRLRLETISSLRAIA